MREDSLLRHTMRVTLETTNRCNMARLHDRCPAHYVTEEEWLPTPTVEAIMDYMAHEKFGREIAYHNYCDPLVEPRLLHFMDYCRAVGAAKDQYILTNGLLLNQATLDELVAHGATRVWVSVYSDEELKRIRMLDVPKELNWRLLRIKELDHRMEIYDRDYANLHAQCSEPLESLLVRANGDVALCCMDWRGTVTFGNLRDRHLSDILAEGKMQAVWEQNMQGRRHLDVCRRCVSKRVSKLYTTREEFEQVTDTVRAAAR